jgi:transcriptional regulator with XRE-family HTH domain
LFFISVGNNYAKGLCPMSESFRERFLKEAGEHPYAWAGALGLPKDLVTAVVRGKDDYQPIRRTLEKLARATGRPVSWWLTGEEGDTPQGPSPEHSRASAKAPVVGTAVGGSSRIDPELLEIAARALREWEEARHIKVAEERRSAIVAVLYNHLIEAEASGESADAVVLRGLR